MSPAAPALVSTMHWWPHIAVSLLPTTRASASVPPPGGKPTMMRTGALGQLLWAQPAAGNAKAAAVP